VGRENVVAGADYGFAASALGRYKGVTSPIIFLSSMRRMGRPTVGDEPRTLIAIRLDAKILS